MGKSPQAFAVSEIEWRSPAGTPSRLRLIDSRELFAGHTEIGIEHEGAHYRLKITRQGKLILNK